MLHVSVARQNADERFLVLLEHPVVAAGFHAIQVGRDGEHRENDVLARDGEIVHQRDVGRFEPLFARQVALFVGDAERHIFSDQAARFVAEEVEIARVRRQARVRGHGLAFQLAVIIPLADGFERVGIHLHRVAVFFKREQLAGVIDRRGVVDVARLALDAGIVGERIAILAVQRTARGALRLPALGLDVAHLEIDVAVLEAEQADHAVAAQERVVAEHGRILRIGNGTIPGAVDLLRHSAFGDQIVDVALDAGWRVPAREVHRIGERLCHGLPAYLAAAF